MSSVPKFGKLIVNVADDARPCVKENPPKIFVY